MRRFRVGIKPSPRKNDVNKVILVLTVLRIQLVQSEITRYTDRRFSADIPGAAVAPNCMSCLKSPQINYVSKVAKYRRTKRCGQNDVRYFFRIQKVRGLVDFAIIAQRCRRNVIALVRTFSPDAGVRVDFSLNVSR